MWKTLRPVPNRRHVAEMVRLLEAYREESPDFYAFYEFDGTVKVTPARLIGFLYKAMKVSRRQATAHHAGPVPRGQGVFTTT